MAESDGMIGYFIKQELDNNIKGSPRVVTLLTSVEVDPDDQEFQNPTKTIGNTYTVEEAKLLLERWTIDPEYNKCRRLVPSPKPLSIPDISTIELLLENKIVVVCGGGGGIPVSRSYDGKWGGVEAIIDKDRTAGLIAKSVKADMLLLLTDVCAVYLYFGTAKETPIKQITATEISDISLPTTSMGTKVEAACDFVNHSGAIAGIGALEDALEIVQRRSGTIIGC